MLVEAGVTELRAASSANIVVLWTGFAHPSPALLASCNLMSGAWLPLDRHHSRSQQIAYFVLAHHDY